MNELYYMTKIQKSMIEIQSLEILNTYKYISLSSKFGDIEAILAGSWLVYKQSGFNNDNGKIIFEKNGVISYSTYNNNRERWNDEKDWSFVEHKGRNQAAQNSFNVLGMSTMEIVYIDENIIYAKGYADNICIFIKEDAKDIFKTNDDILLYFSKIENKWLKELEKLKSQIPTNYVNWINGPQPYIILVITFLISGFIWKISDNFIIGFISFVVVGLAAIASTIVISRLLLIRWLCKYIQDHPKDKLAEFVSFNNQNIY